MAILNEEAIRVIEDNIKRNGTVELHMEKGNLVVVELSRKVKVKQPVELK